MKTRALEPAQDGLALLDRLVFGLGVAGDSVDSYHYAALLVALVDDGPGQDQEGGASMHLEVVSPYSPPSEVGLGLGGRPGDGVALHRPLLR